MIQIYTELLLNGMRNILLKLNISSEYLISQIMYFQTEKKQNYEYLSSTIITIGSARNFLWKNLNLNESIPQKHSICNYKQKGSHPLLKINLIEILNSINLCKLLCIYASALGLKSGSCCWQASYFT